MCDEPNPLHTELMSNESLNILAGLSGSFSSLVESVSAGVVALKIAPYRTVSGVVLTPDLIAATGHSFRRESTVAVHTAWGDSVSATLIGRDPTLDLTFLKTESALLKPLPASDVSTLKAGTLVAVVGMTADVGASASLGTLGAVGPARRTMRGGTLDHFLRLDVDLYPSQSGAAVVDVHGRLIGLATPGMSRHSVLAIPRETLERVAALVQQEGKNTQGYIGAGFQLVPIPANWQSKVQPATENGLMVLSVETGGPAEQGGLQLGDILITLNGQSIGGVEELQSALRSGIVGQSVPVHLLRAGEPKDLQVVIAERPRKSRC